MIKLSHILIILLLTIMIPIIVIENSISYKTVELIHIIIITVSEMIGLWLALSKWFDTK